MNLVTGSAGFINGKFSPNRLDQWKRAVMNLGKLACTGKRKVIASSQVDPQHILVLSDLYDGMPACLYAAIYFVARRDADRSIYDQREFTRVRIGCADALLEVARSDWSGLESAEAVGAHLHH